MKRTITYMVLAALLICTVLFLIYGYSSVYQVVAEIVLDYWLYMSITIMIYLIFFRKRLDFFNNLIHEFTHLLFLVLAFEKVKGLYVSTTSGIVYSESNNRNILVAIAPYFFPLPTIMLIVLFSMVEFEYKEQIVLLSYLFFIVATAKSLIGSPAEVTSSGIKAIFLFLVLNFWVFYFILSWSSTTGFHFNETLNSINDALTRTISQFRPV